MAEFTEEQWLSILSEDARECFLAWRKLGYDPKKALAEVERAGLWVDEARTRRYLRRPVAFYTDRLGNRAAPANAANTQLPLAGRVLASWQMLTAQELAWLRALADGKALCAELTAEDVQEILKINDESAAELREWEKKNVRVSPLNSERAGPYASIQTRAMGHHWWRKEPVSYWTARWKA
jgi:hypothetical protein